MSRGLAAFMKARLDEAEAAARAATPEGCTSEWQAGVPDGEGGREHLDSVHDTCVTAGEAPEYQPHGHVIVYDEGSPSPEQAAFIARNDPARVLREAEADRGLLEAWSLAEGDTESESAGGYADGLRRAVECRALAHSDHPDYRPEWQL